MKLSLRKQSFVYQSFRKQSLAGWPESEGEEVNHVQDAGMTRGNMLLQGRRQLCDVQG